MPSSSSGGRISLRQVSSSSSDPVRKGRKSRGSEGAHALAADEEEPSSPPGGLVWAPADPADKTDADKTAADKDEDLPGTFDSTKARLSVNTLNRIEQQAENIIRDERAKRRAERQRDDVSFEIPMHRMFAAEDYIYLDGTNFRE